MTTSETAHIYRCEITLWEPTFFASREISAFYQTEPLIGNYALAYALGLCAAPYHSDTTVRYKADLLPLNQRGVYVTPATILGEPKFTLSQFNAQTDAYWYAFANNAIVTRPDDRRARKDGTNWYIVDPVTGSQQKVTANNFPQHGRIKMLALGNRAVCYVIAREPLPLPRYIRLGKWMSKASVEVTHATSRPEQRPGETVSVFLNPADLPDPKALGTFDLVSIHPVPLIRHARLAGAFYRAPDGGWLPAGMRFGVESLP
ncbi:MAG: type I-D CRISPR-associated protein Cas5/Csc1 [Anaerolineae bacterium CG2_30_64_16]|nr:MAG: type I-D CRISPR-associated protein Cas5/Csc1 [Anaerolineae bacterium CG2_30_64_16]